MDNLETKIEAEQVLKTEPQTHPKQGIANYIRGCFDPDNARLYGILALLSRTDTLFTRKRGSNLGA